MIRKSAQRFSEKIMHNQKPKARSSRFRAKKTIPPGRDGKTRYDPRTYPRLVLAVLLGVVPARLYMMMLGVAGMAVGGVRMMRRLLVIAGLVMLGGFPMMLCRMLMVLGRLLVMLNALMFAHISLPV
jgi:hypothetical protein